MKTYHHKLVVLSHPLFRTYTILAVIKTKYIKMVISHSFEKLQSEKINQNLFYISVDLKKQTNLNFKYYYKCINTQVCFMLVVRVVETALHSVGKILSMTCISTTVKYM